MADEKFDDGLLNQDDIDAALEAARRGEHAASKENPGKNPPAPGSTARTRKAIDAAPSGGAAPLKGSPTPSSAGRRPAESGRPFDEVAAAMAEAVAAESAAGTGALPKSAARRSPSASSAAPLEIPLLEDQVELAGEAQSIDLLRDVNLDVKIELGRSRMYVEDVLRLNEGSIVELDKLAGDPVDVLVNGRLVARGEVLVLNDNFCVRINDIVSRLPSEEVPV
jgi:flagellar motor switch protein FliN/FliY